MDIESQKTLDEVVGRVNQALQDRISQAFASLEGLEVTIGPITIPAFTVKLGSQH